MSQLINLMGMAVFCGLLLSGVSRTWADELAEAPKPEYLGEIRRDANGQLIVVPFEKTTDAEAGSRPPSGGEVRGSAGKGDVDLPISRILRVGPSHALKRIADAAAIAKDGDVIEIEAGDYVGDVAVWKQRALVLRGVGGRPRLIANGASIDGKGIWVMRGGDITVENIEFFGAQVPDRNGAGIRFEKGRLTVRNCRFAQNENGILAGGGDLELTIEDSEFAHNGHGDGYSHHLYAGKMNRLSVSGSYFHHGQVGHLIKSRARVNHLINNRITDETGGRASYEIDLPNGGVAWLVGNVIEQSATTENSHLVSFGVEGYAPSPSRLVVAHNTFVNSRAEGGRALRVAPGQPEVAVVNNVFIGRFDDAPASLGPGNVLAQAKDVVALDRLDLRPIKGRAITRQAVAPIADIGVELKREYDHPASTRPIAPPLLPGAVQTWFVQ